jgi:hypothetical protein
MVTAKLMTGDFDDLWLQPVGGSSILVVTIVVEFYFWKLSW